MQLSTRSQGKPLLSIKGSARPHDGRENAQYVAGFCVPADDHCFGAWPLAVKRVEYDHNVSRKKKPAVTLPGTVEKIIPPSQYADEPVECADPVYKEIRVENTLQDEEGREVALRPGAEVEVTIEAEPHQTTPKKTCSRMSAQRKNPPKSSESTGLDYFHDHSSRP